jgi:glucose/arabinose dehydrogenase
VPLDNPSFNVMGARREIYAYGFRNPYRFAAASGDKLLVADVGEVSFEEVNLLMRGANYGWPQQEGLCNGCASVNPIYAYPHGAGAAITSVLVYTGSEFGPSYTQAVCLEVSAGFIDNDHDSTRIAEFPSKSGRREIRCHPRRDAQI